LWHESIVPRRQGTAQIAEEVEGMVRSEAPVNAHLTLAIPPLLSQIHAMPKPKEKARVRIDALLEESGWKVQDRQAGGLPGV